MPDFAAAANAADSKKKPNKTIIYSAAGAAAVILLVAGVFGTKWFLRAQAYSSAIASIDSVKNVAKKRGAKSSNGVVRDVSMIDFFTRTGGAPNKTLFKEVKTPEEGLAKYDAVMKQLSNRRNAFGDKAVAEKIDSAKETYEKFRKHADSASKLFKIVDRYSGDIKRGLDNAYAFQNGNKESVKYVADVIGKLNSDVSGFGSGDKDFDKTAKSLMSDLNKIIIEMLNNVNAGGSPYGTPDVDVDKLINEVKYLVNYFDETANLRDQFVSKLDDLRSTLVSKK